MAEGHAVVRWARALAPLVGEPITAITVPPKWRERAATLIDASIARIETRGKHLLLHSSRSFVIHCHAMQYGSWQVGEPGMALRKADRYVRLRLRTAEHEAVYFHGPVMELLTNAELEEHPALRALGPDLLHDGFDRDDARRRLAAAGDRPIGDVVLDQRVVAGIGNIYKSEGLFLARLDPRRAAETVASDEIARLWDVLVPLMHEGTRAFGAITTLPAELRVGGQRTWVYRRRGRPCFRCGATVQMIRQGELERATYFCPGCQR